LIRLWSGARLTGLFSAARRQSVVAALLQEIFMLIGGDNWGAAEGRFRGHDGAAALEVLERAISNKAPGTHLAAKVFLDRPAYAAIKTKDRVIRLGATARHLLQLPAPERTVPMYRGDGVTVVRRRFGPEDWNCEFALRLASSPETVEVWAGQNLEH